MSSQPENREQTFDEKLDAILLRLIISNGKDGLMGTPDSSFLEAKQAIKTLVLEDVVGGDESSKARDDKLRQSPPWQRNQLRLKQRQIINPQENL